MATLAVINKLNITRRDIDLHKNQQHARPTMPTFGRIILILQGTGRGRYLAVFPNFRVEVHT